MEAFGGNVLERPDGRFGWHPAARLFDGVGREHFRVTSGPALIAERPAGLAISQAIAAGSFRVGGEGPAPMGAFETLTSGSSGSPRRIRRSPASWLASFAINAGLFGIGPGLRVAVLGRLSQSLALYGALEGMHLGAEVHLLDDLRPDRQAKALEQRRVALIYLTPAQARLLVEGKGKLPALRTVLIGGSKLDAGLRSDLMRMAPGAELHEFYGAAEASFITLAEPDSPAESVGKAYPGVEIKVDAAGVIWVKSPYLFEGYAGDDTGGARWGDGFLTVGEMGALQDGYLYLSGRAGRMVTVADQNVFPEEIEAFLMELPGVRQVAVVPVADDLRGMHLVAILQGNAAEEAAILRAARGRLGALKAPKRLIWREDWPVLPSGKTDLRAIVEGMKG